VSTTSQRLFLGFPVASLGARQAYLDGELCGVFPDGITSFGMIQAASDAGNAALVYFIFDLVHLDGEDVGARPLIERKTLVVSDPEILGGDPVFRGTRVPVHLIAELVAQGSKPDELIEGYPRLTAEMIRLAPVYAAAYPLRGPRRKQPWRDQQPVRRGRRKLDTIAVS
jgi:uncharacterized protein (DUF433 family)